MFYYILMILTAIITSALIKRLIAVTNSENEITILMTYLFSYHPNNHHLHDLHSNITLV